MILLLIPVITTPQAADLLDGATSVIYLKGNSSRSEMISSFGTQATIIDGKTGNVTMLEGLWRTEIYDQNDT